MVREHGTRARYAAGCRCRRCKGAWADYIRTRRRATGRDDRATSQTRLDARRTRSIVERAVETETDPEFPVKLSPLGGQILVSIQQQTGRSRGEVIDDLLRQVATNRRRRPRPGVVPSGLPVDGGNWQ
jgi:hypothetical protein